MKKVILAIGCIILLCAVVFISISSYQKNALKEKYEAAVAAAENKDFETAKKLFGELPPDYQYEKKVYDTITAQDWIDDINKYCDSPFIGEWTAKNSQGNWKIDIHISVIDFKGVYLAYNKSYTSPGGVRLGDFGDIYLYNDGVTASYTNSGESNAKHYKLVLTSENTLELYFQNELEVTLHKK